MTALRSGLAVALALAAQAARPERLSETGATPCPRPPARAGPVLSPGAPARTPVQRSRSDHVRDRSRHPVAPPSPSAAPRAKVNSPQRWWRSPRWSAGAGDRGRRRSTARAAPRWLGPPSPHAGRPLPAEVARRAGAARARSQRGHARASARARRRATWSSCRTGPAARPSTSRLVARTEPDGTALVLHRVARGVQPAAA